jgi:hypothetical protein
MSTPRFCTYISDTSECTSNMIRVLLEGEQLPEDYNEYVWQYATDVASAINQHDSKMDLWRSDINSGMDEKHTY